MWCSGAGSRPGRSWGGGTLASIQAGSSKMHPGQLLGACPTPLPQHATFCRSSGCKPVYHVGARGWQPP